MNLNPITYVQSMNSVTIFVHVAWEHQDLDFNTQLYMYTFLFMSHKDYKIDHVSWWILQIHITYEKKRFELEHIYQTYNIMLGDSNRRTYNFKDLIHITVNSESVKEQYKEQNLINWCYVQLI